MTDEHAHIEEARDAGREVAWQVGKRTIRGVLLAFLIFGLALTIIGDVVYHQALQSCTSRQEGREGIRELVFFAIGQEPQAGENPRAAELRALVAPGGKLGPIEC